MTKPEQEASATAQERFLDAQLEETAEDLYENAPCGYLSAMPDGTIVKVNQTFLTWTSYRREELVGQRKFQDLLTGGGRIYHETHLAPLLRMQGAVKEIALELRCGDGRQLPVLINSTVRYDDAGEPLLTRTTVFDATDRRRYEQELVRAREHAEKAAARARVLAQTLQSSFIPPALPTVPGLDVGAVYRPAGDGSEVGGDFYDVFETARGDWAVVLGDVCGKGAEAASVTALARHTVRATSMSTRRPKRVLGALNEALYRHDTERFCTAVYARVRPSRHGPCRLTVATAGHPLPILVTGDGSSGEAGRPGDLLGVTPTVALHDVSVELHPGDALVFFTDGVTDARQQGRFFGEDALRARALASRGGNAQMIAEAILADVMTFQGGVARDDIAIVVLKVPAS